MALLVFSLPPGPDAAEQGVAPGVSSLLRDLALIPEATAVLVCHAQILVHVLFNWGLSLLLVLGHGIWEWQTCALQSDFVIPWKRLLEKLAFNNSMWIGVIANNAHSVPVSLFHSYYILHQPLGLGGKSLGTNVWHGMAKVTHKAKCGQEHMTSSPDLYVKQDPMAHGPFVYSLFLGVSDIHSTLQRKDLEQKQYYDTLSELLTFCYFVFIQNTFANLIQFNMNFKPIWNYHFLRLCSLQTSLFIC